jgi:glutamate synthase domain-containing protein 2
MPLVDGLRFVDNALRGAGIRDQTKIICAGKIIHGYNIVEKLALGADLCKKTKKAFFVSFPKSSVNWRGSLIYLFVDNLLVT